MIFNIIKVMIAVKNWIHIYIYIYTMCVMLVYSEGYQSRENAHNISKEEDTET